MNIAILSVSLLMLSLVSNAQNTSPWPATGSVGIGTTTPGDLLHVNGIARANQLNLVNGVLNTASGTTNMSFNINGTNRMTLLAASGNLGIGTATPGDLLHVNGIARANQLNLVNGVLNTASGTTNMSFNINGTNRMTLLAASGNLGIGIAAPADLLHVNGIARANQLNLVNGVLNTASGTTNMSFNINGTNRMTLLAASGNLGIGTATPGDLLHVNGIARANQLNLVNGVLNTASGTTNMSFNINGTNRMTLLAASGNLGIGTATPAHRLDVAGTINATSILVNGQPVSVAPSQWVNGTGNISYSAGNVGIGTATPSSPLHVRKTNTPAGENLLTMENAGTTSLLRTLLMGIGEGTQVTHGQGFIAGTDIAGNRKTFLRFDPQWSTVHVDQNLFFLNSIALQAASTTGATVNLLSFNGSNQAVIGPTYPAAFGTIFSIGNTSADYQWTPAFSGPLMTLKGTGNLGIGTTNPTQKLTVNGVIYGKEVKVDANVPGPDYVFEKDYDLLSLEDLRSYIESNKHLPEVPSAKEMEANGLNLSEMNLLLLKKVEELTLHLLAMDERMKALQKQLDDRGQK